MAESKWLSLEITVISRSRGGRGGNMRFLCYVMRKKRKTGSKPSEINDIQSFTVKIQ